MTWFFLLGLLTSQLTALVWELNRTDAASLARETGLAPLQCWASMLCSISCTKLEVFPSSFTFQDKSQRKRVALCYFLSQRIFTVYCSRALKVVRKGEWEDMGETKNRISLLASQMMFCCIEYY